MTGLGGPFLFQKAEIRMVRGFLLFRLELRKLLEPENYVNGGFGFSKFVAQHHKDNLGV